MHRNLFDKVNIDPAKDQPAGRHQPRCTRMPACKVQPDHPRVGGVDLQLLGIGHDGHIGFNEPGEAFEKETHCVDPDPRGDH